MVRMENLVGAMIGGRAEKKPGVSDNPPAQWTKALGALAVSVAIAGWIYAGAPPFA